MGPAPRSRIGQFPRGENTKDSMSMKVKVDFVSSKSTLTFELEVLSCPGPIRK